MSRAKFGGTGPRWRHELVLSGTSLRDGDPVTECERALAQAGWSRESIEPLALLIAELWHNALEHGVLGLDSALKDRPGGYSDYYVLREQLLRSVTQGRVRILLEQVLVHGEAALAIEIEDSGAGFDTAEPRAPLPAGKSVRKSGRGLRLVRELCESLEFSGRGNVARATCRWEGPLAG